jgi:hypothetical protein
MVDRKCGNGCPTNRGFPFQQGSVSAPPEVFLPSVESWVEQWNSSSTFRIDGFDPICLVTVAHRTCEGEIRFLGRATARFRTNVVDLKKGTDDTLGRQAIAAPKTRPFCHATT